MAEKVYRNIVVIDEEKCDGCGLCVTGCAEGALAIIDGKAKLISETYCDGLGACLGECPRGAINIEKREAATFNEEAVEKHLASLALQAMPGHGTQISLNSAQPAQAPTGCPGSMTRTLNVNQAQAGTPKICPGSMVRKINVGNAQPQATDTDTPPSVLHNWPIQLGLLPINAPYLNNADLLIAADCVGFSLPNFQQRFLSGRVLTIGCPKLDDVMGYKNKLVEIFRRNNINSVHVLYMEVPCCGSLVRLVQAAIDEAGINLDFSTTCIGIEGDIVATS
jgi:Pyruvate/2-oxoacid:ferredoxin oxidoreductase delta subunit